MTSTGRQIREAREALGWELWRVATAAGVRVSELILAEAADDRCPTDARLAEAVRQALQAAGVEFIPEEGGGAGVRLRKAAAGAGTGDG